ncbi:toxin-antitoxin system YwqK family antitoxin [Delftia tsuruhatensis]|uniref:toxin-antitoxin system YwqK family antitoxin n=1 Tax=Delftia tsuruhatensis TaxID=180282 RepID=UPI001EF43707|nr:hypothetical protein [Delftia tsuruhatensis]
MKDFNKNRVNEDALEADDDVVIYNGVPFNGVGFDNFADGSVIEYETEYKNGFPHGMKKKWYKNGELAYSISYFNGLKHGEENHWYPSGQSKLFAVYEYGVKVNSILWNENGEVVERFSISQDSINFTILQKRRLLGWDHDWIT